MDDEMMVGGAILVVVGAVEDFFLVVVFLFGDFCLGDLVWWVYLSVLQEQEWFYDGAGATLEASANHSRLPYVLPLIDEK